MYMDHNGFEIIRDGKQIMLTPSELEQVFHHMKRVHAEELLLNMIIRDELDSEKTELFMQSNSPEYIAFLDAIIEGFESCELHSDKDVCTMVRNLLADYMPIGKKFEFVRTRNGVLVFDNGNAMPLTAQEFSRLYCSQSAK